MSQINGWIIQTKTTSDAPWEDQTLGGGEIVYDFEQSEQERDKLIKEGQYYDVRRLKFKAHL